MKKTTVYLEPELDRAVGRLACPAGDLEGGGDPPGPPRCHPRPRTA